MHIPKSESQLVEIEEFYNSLGDNIPEELKSRLNELKNNLK